ncbi:MAG: hydrogenase iron-sulfur subunit [Desulfovibrio sp.]|nr:hydrogenase iron-sulfur subunit [Desulfovibrio sp.]
MAQKIGVYLDRENIGGGLNLDELAAKTKEKWGELTPVVKVVPIMAESVPEIEADIKANDLDGVLLCGASPRVDSGFYRFPQEDGRKILVDHVNLREQCVLCYENPDGSPVDPRVAPELLKIMAQDYINMGVVQLQKTTPADPAVVKGVRRILVIGGGWTGMHAAIEASKSGYEVVLIEKNDKLGGAVNNIPVASPLRSPWADKEPTHLSELIEDLDKDPNITVCLNATMKTLVGEPGEYKAIANVGGEEKSWEVGAVVVATGWVPLSEKYLAPMGLGSSPAIITAAQFAQMLVKNEVKAKRIAFVLDTTIAEKAFAAEANEPEKDILEAEASGKNAESDGENMDQPYVKEDLESIKHLAYSNVVNSVGMLRQANIICDKTGDAVQAYIIYKNMAIPGILERFYRTMQNRLGIMMTKADVTSVKDHGDRVVVSCENTLLGMDFDLDVDLVVLPCGIVPTTAKELVVNFDYRQGPDFPDLELFDGYADSNYICFPYETRRTGVYAAGCVRQPMTLDLCEEDACGAVLKAIECIESGDRGVAVAPRSGDRTHPIFNFLRCTQCKRCTVECPFGALDDDEKGTPKPNPSRCRRCGTCFGACPERVISFADYNIDQVSAMLRQPDIPKNFKEGGPRILIMACENDAYPALDMAGLRHKKWSPYCRIIPVRCLGSVNAIWISDAMNKGYDGVLLMGCKYGDDYQCHFMKGSELSHLRMENIAETLNRLRVEPERVEQLEVAIDEYDRIPELIDGFVDRITALGPNPFKGM